MFLKKIIIAAIIIFLSLGNVFARSATDEENASLRKALDDYNIIMNNNDYKQLINNTITPRFAQALSEHAGGVSPEIIKAKTLKLLQMMSMSDISFDLDAIKTGELDDGEPYFLITATGKLTFDNETFHIESQFIAVMEDGKWYFVDPTNSPLALDILTKLFPGIEKIDMMESVVEPIEE